MKYSDIDKNLESRYKDIKLDYDIDAILNSIENILMVRKGELVGRPEFGSDVQKFLFDDMSEITYAGIEEAIIIAIDRWEPRVITKDVTVNHDPSNNIVVFEILFVIVETNLEYTHRMEIEI